VKLREQTQGQITAKEAAYNELVDEVHRAARETMRGAVEELERLKQTPVPAIALLTGHALTRQQCLFIWEEEEIGGGYHQFIVGHATAERDWDEPYRRTGVAEYRSRVVAYVPRSELAAAIAAKEAAELSLKYEQVHYRTAAEERDRLSAELAEAKGSYESAAADRHQLMNRRDQEMAAHDNEIQSTIVRAVRFAAEFSSSGGRPIPKQDLNDLADAIERGDVRVP